ncbi:efflux RND transporter periplasmic adaptor subunit [Granulicella sp. 5B5]|uniref:efflux RND transporter periplasmic adaptor subunit n=1 Tax=Granulicella sp. 5B5 TaxID=1617967 RepID=UPI0015F39019|nr:efflux RND transporter periplasmic adaptor subunit [Granulicella sp. 5B5]QMV18509.1 efflux RND transporter periplasmic adaptor subunit [Granulicella sp. 5B5]
MTSTATNTNPPRRQTARIVGAVVLLGVLLAIGIVPRVIRGREARDVVQASTVLLPEVTVVHPELAPAKSSVSLPGNLLPLYSASIFARTSGYVEKRFVDIGSHVKAGQVLAIIATPEVDQQLNQARADVLQAAAAVEQSKAALEQAQANLDIARITRNRYTPLIKRHAVTQQALDEADAAFNARTADASAARANIDVTEASLKSKQANVERLSALKGFDRIVAPFEGVITSRNIEQGDLVNDGSNGGAKSLFSVAQSDVLRVQVEVPQSDALAIKAGQQATLTVQERPGRRYIATVTRSAESVDLAARTMLTEVQVDNHDGSLLPGMYGQVSFDVAASGPSLIIPSTALVIDKNGMHVVSVSADSRVHFIPVNIGQDQGAQVEISQGLHGGETLVSNPSDLLSDGQKVSLAQ